ncbi:MAG: MtrB/PioB family decaheme-associated outer membrane protein [Magnetococcales bacterium]|nr:MtrB/PioB family decaheme-associated outer membrane protein [Magnetococcales bacterium]
MTLALAGAACLATGLWGSVPARSEPEENREEREGIREMSPTAAPFVKPESAVSVGVGYQGGHREQLGMFDGQTDSDGRLLLDAQIRKRDEATGTWATALGRNLGLNDNRDVKLGYERQGNWGVNLEYSETPRLAPYSVNTKIAGLGTTHPVIPKTSTNPPTNTTYGNGANFQIGTDRDRFSLNAFRLFSNKVKFNLGFRNEVKEGTRQWGKGSAPEFLVEPIHWEMRQWEPTLSYTGEQWQWLGGYSGSWFKNGNTLVDVTYQGDNPATLANHTYLSQPLDNEAHQLFLSGGYNITPETRSTFKFAHTRALQNEPFPTSTITGLPLVAALPTRLSRSGAPSSLQGEVDTTSVLLGLTARPWSKLSVTTRLRYQDIHDKTPTWLVATLPNPPALPTTQVHSTPLSSRTITGQLEGIYRLPYHMLLTGGVEHRDQKRQIPFGNDIVRDGKDDERFVPWRSELDETTYKIQVRRHLSETVNGSLGFEHSVREGDPYIRSVKILGNIRPFFIENRERDKLRFSTDWRPMERLGLQFNVDNILDRYDLDQNAYGRQKSYSQLYSVDADYAPTDKWLLTAWYSYDTAKTWQHSGRWSQPANAAALIQHEADKESLLTDMGSSVGLGMRHQWDEHVKLGINFQRSQTRSSFEDRVTVDPTATARNAYPTSGGVTVSPLADITSPMTRLNAFAEYKGWGPGTLRGEFIHERWRTDDWTWQTSDGKPFVYGTTTDGTLISRVDDQTSHYVGLRYTTHFQ